MNALDSLALELTDLILPFVGILISVTLGILLYNLTKSIAASFGFKALGYREGEEIILNDERAIVTRIGLLSSSFLILNGNDNVVKWATFPSSRLEWQNIKRISLNFKKLEESK